MGQLIVIEQFSQGKLAFALEKDLMPLIGERLGELFQSAVQHAQVKVYAGVAHYPMAEANTELLDDLVQFLEPARDCRHA